MKGLSFKGLSLAVLLLFPLFGIAAYSYCNSMEEYCAGYYYGCCDDGYYCAGSSGSYYCALVEYCGDTICQTWNGEDCQTCSQDCGCTGIGQICSTSGTCVCGPAVCDTYDYRTCSSGSNPQQIIAHDFSCSGTSCLESTYVSETCPVDDWVCKNIVSSDTDGCVVGSFNPAMCLRHKWDFWCEQTDAKTAVCAHHTKHDTQCPSAGCADSGTAGSSGRCNTGTLTCTFDYTTYCGSDGWECNGNTRRYRDNYCSSGSCQTSYSSQTDCTASNGWYNNGSSYACCNGTSTGRCQNQDYRNYYCGSGACSYVINNTRMNFVANRTCMINNDTCLNSTRMRDYTAATCSGGNCSDVYTDRDCTSCVVQPGDDNCITNTPPVVQPMSYTGTCNNGDTITLQCNATDAQQQSSTLAVRAWAGQCSASDCFSTRSWTSGTGTTYYVNSPMTPPASGDNFTSVIVISQPVGSGIAATCQATDNQLVASNFGDAYPLCVVNGCASPPQITNMMVNPNVSTTGTVSIGFDAADVLSSTAVTVTPLGLTPMTATYLSKTGNTYAYAFSVYPTTGDGPAVVRTDVTRQSDNCPSTVFSPLIIDTQAPATSVTCNDAACGPGVYRDAALNVTLECTDATSGCAITYYGINSNATLPYYSPITIVASGEYNITYNSLDRAGNGQSGRQRLTFESTANCTGVSCTMGEDTCIGDSLRDYTDARCIDGMCSDVYTDVACQYGCMFMPGNDLCAPSPKPVLNTTTVTGTYQNCVASNGLVIVQSTGRDPFDENVMLRCGTARGYADICTGNFVLRDPSCNFTAPWPTSSDNTIFCFIEDESSTRSDTVIPSSVITDNDPPVMFVDMEPNGVSFLPGTETNFSVAAGDSGCGVRMINISLDGTLIDSDCTGNYCSHRALHSYGWHTYDVTVFDYMDNAVAQNVTFRANNRPNITAPIAYSGQCQTGRDVTVYCNADDTDQPANTLAVRAWAGQCSGSSCFETRSWATGNGTTYLQDSPMTLSGGLFTTTFTVTQNSGTAIAATCRAVDDMNDTNEPDTQGDMYPLCVVNGCVDPPVINITSLTPNPIRSGAATIEFTVDKELAADPVVTVTPDYENGGRTEYNATLSSRNGNNYVYEINVTDVPSQNALVIVHARGVVDDCPSEEIATLTVDKTPPETRVLCNGEPCRYRVYRSPVVITFDCSDALSSCEQTFYSVNGFGQEWDFNNPQFLTETGRYNISYSSTDTLGNTENGDRVVRIYSGTCVGEICSVNEEIVVQLLLDRKTVHSGEIISGKILCFLRDSLDKSMKTRECSIYGDSDISISVDQTVGTTDENYTIPGNTSGNAIDFISRIGKTPGEFVTENGILPETPLAIDRDSFSYSINKYWTIDIDTGIFHSLICVNMTDNESGMGGVSCDSYIVSDVMIEPQITFPDIVRGVIPFTTDGSGSPNFTKLMPTKFEIRPYIVPQQPFVPSLCTDINCRVYYDFIPFDQWSGSEKIAEWNGFAGAYVPKIQDVITNYDQCNTYKRLYVRAYKQGGPDSGLFDDNWTDMFINCDTKVTVDPVEARYAMGEMPGKVFDLTLWNPSNDAKTFSLETITTNANGYPLAWISLDCGGQPDCTAGPGDDSATVGVTAMGSRTLSVMMTKAVRSGAFPLTFIATGDSGDKYSANGNILIFSEGLSEFAAWQLLILLGIAVYALFFSGLKV